MSKDDLRKWNAASQNRAGAIPKPGTEVPGDTDAADIVGRTGEEMPEVAHGEPHVTRADTPVLPGIDPTKPSSMPRAEDDVETRAHSPEFHDRPGSGALIAERHRVFDNAARPGDKEEAAEGQLGPDELPDPTEVVMNQEAKHH